jgi:Amino acid permease
VPGSLVGDLLVDRPQEASLAQTAATARRHQAVGRRTRALLFFAFAFAVMADPVSSVAYAIEAALRALHGHLHLLLPTMGLVIGIIALVTLNYWQLVRAFPEGGGSPEAAGRAFGEQWSFLPIGALVVDFALTIAISIAAAGSAMIAYFPALAPGRIPLALGLLLLVAGLTWFGHFGRLIFAVMTWLFIIAAVAVLGLGWTAPHSVHGHAPITGSASPALVAVILAFPVAMALATGTEAPATSIAQLGQLDNRSRARFGRGTLVLTIGIVGALTLGLTALAVHLHVGIPKHDSTQIADLAHAAAGNGGLFAFFQLSSGLLLLAAASSSFQAGPGLLKALARSRSDGQPGLLPARLGRTNQHHTPVAAVIVYTLISAAIILAASGQEQELVLVYAVAVFVSFLAGLLAMARFSARQGARALTATNLLGAVVVAFTLVVNLARGYPLLSIAGAMLVAGFLYSRWVRAGRPRGIEAVERQAEAEDP